MDNVIDGNFMNYLQEVEWMTSSVSIFMKYF